MILPLTVPWLLVVQPDGRQADLLRNAVHSRVAADLVVVESLQEAVVAIERAVPDVVLLSSLIPAAEDYVCAYLATLPYAGHVQVLLMPHLGRGDHAVTAVPSWQVRWWRRHDPPIVTQPWCDPAMFTRDLAAYLARAQALKAQHACHEPCPVSLGRPERRRDRRFLNHEVPWISVVRIGTERADLIDVSSRGALLRTHTRPAPHMLRRTDRYHERPPHIVLELDSGPAVQTTGRVVRCLPLTAGAGMKYKIAFAFDDSIGLHLPATALVPVEDDDEAAGSVAAIRRNTAW